MSEYRDLFNWKPDPQRTRADQIREAFEQYHSDNPQIWELFEKYTLATISRGHEHYGSSSVFERIRWHFAVDTKGPEAKEVKINNNFKPYYARMFHTTHPQHDGFFRNRELNSERKLPEDPNRQVF